jgi:hypothetical protein
MVPFLYMYVPVLFLAVLGIRDICFGAEPDRGSVPLTNGSDPEAPCGQVIFSLKN